MKIKIVILFKIFTISFLLITCTNSSAFPPHENEQFKKFATIDVLVVIYSNTAGKKILASEIDGLKNGIQLAREFIWRNSGCNLNLNIKYLEIDEFKRKQFFPGNGLLFPEFVEDDFLKHGIQPDQYGIIFLIYSPPKGGGNYGGMKIFVETGYSFFQFPCKTSVLYPGDNTQINYGATWLFTHEIQNSIDLVCYEGSGTPEMWHGDKPLDYSMRAGEQFSYQAEIFRNFNKYLAIKSPWGRIDQSTDGDNDGLPDNDVRIPLDELRFGSDSTKSDTDYDGLNDLQEFTCGIYKSSDAKNKDTDNDGKNDGKDIFPLNDLYPHIPKMRPLMDSKWDSWYLINNTLDFSSQSFFLDSSLNTKIFMSWDNNFLYVGCEMDAPAELHLDIDLLNNGWWHGKDNYRLVADPFSTRFNEIRVMDATVEAREFRKSLGKGFYEMWDDEPEYIGKFGRIIDESSVELFTKAYEDKYLIKIKIPNNNRIPFQLKENKQIGFRIYFTAQELGSTKSWATVFEQYEFFQVTLK
ncbi:hypothetical protein H8E88_20995 [candidate division KSB1 bacterium]|nr:hypothetical protein [candidate division KSB1 bacterium]